MKELKCKICGGNMDPSHLQQGNCHYLCFNNEITVYKIYLIDDTDGTYYVEKDINKIVETIECLSGDSDDDGIAIRKTTMLHGQYIHLPDFQGF